MGCWHQQAGSALPAAPQSQPLHLAFNSVFHEFLNSDVLSLSLYTEGKTKTLKAGVAKYQQWPLCGGSYMGDPTSTLVSSLTLTPSLSQVKTNKQTKTISQPLSSPGLLDSHHERIQSLAIHRKQGWL